MPPSLPPAHAQLWQRIHSDDALIGEDGAGEDRTEARTEFLTALAGEDGAGEVRTEAGKDGAGERRRQGVMEAHVFFIIVKRFPHVITQG